MDFSILGPFVVRDREGAVIPVPGGRERSLLALLLIHRDEVVSSDRIVDALWGESAPATAAKAVQGYVSHLRRLLEPGEHDGVLLTRLPGYVLRTGDETVDAWRFERLAGDGRRALEDGSAEEAARILDEALAIWRGPALVEFAFEDFARSESRRLDDLRLSAMEDRFESLLRLGRHGEISGQLDALVAAHPLRERLRGQLMLALYRSGRQSEALETYRDGRRLLAGELGLEPGPELQRLERAILAQDPALEAPAPAPVPVPPSARRDPPAPGRPSDRRASRRRLALVGVVAAATVAAAALIFVLTRSGTPAAATIVAPAVVAVDPATNHVVASISVGSRPVTVAAGEGGVWVGDARDFTVTRIDPATRHVTKVIGIGAPAIDLAVGAGAVWVATGGFGAIVQVDPKLGTATNTIELGDPGNPVVPAATAVGVTRGRVWVGALDGLVGIDPESGRQVNRVDLGQAAALQIAAGNGSVWATTFANRAKRVEASSAQVTTEFYAGTFVFPIALDRSAVWVGAGASGQLWRIDPVTGVSQGTAHAGTGASAIALGFHSVWVTSRRSHTLFRLDSSGKVLDAIPMGGTPEDVVVAGGLVWVAVQAAGR